MKGSVKDMNVEQIVELIQAVSASSIGELNYEEGNLKISLKKEENKTVLTSAEPVSCAVPKPMVVSETKAELPAADEKVIKSPLVGTFYAAPAENAEPFIKVGDQVQEGKVLGIVEAMKLMNEIESEFDGVIEKILVENGEIVEYGQPLFVVR